MSLDLLKFLAEGGAIALSVAANVALVMWIRKINSRNEELTDKLFDTIKECSEAMTEARISTAAGADEMARTVKTLTQVISGMQSRGSQ